MICLSKAQWRALLEGAKNPTDGPDSPHANMLHYHEPMRSLVVTNGQIMVWIELDPVPSNESWSINTHEIKSTVLSAPQASLDWINGVPSIGRTIDHEQPPFADILPKAKKKHWRWAFDPSYIAIAAKIGKALNKSLIIDTALGAQPLQIDFGDSNWHMAIMPRRT